MNPIERQDHGETQDGGGDRRLFLRTLGIGTVALAAACTTSPEAGGGGNEAEVTPGEDLMQEHGVLERLLLVYEEVASRLERGAPADTGLASSAADIVRRFVEDYHEQLEEQHVFPRLEAARREAGIVATLRQQHRRGRELTTEILRLSAGGDAGALAEALRSFSRMYRPHAAREDTVLFPAFRHLVGAAAYRELGEAFEEQEHQRFGEHGFQAVVAQVADLERALGIHDLASFTPA
jgi:hemerythrin-like domain-containing protein